MEWMFRLPVQAALIAGMFVVGCSSNPRSQLPTAPSEPPAVSSTAQTRALPDPATALIAEAEASYASGEQELKLGHHERARVHFERAVAVLLDAPPDVRSQAGLQKHLDGLIARISAHEVETPARDPAFAEQKDDTATIDRILEVAGSELPAPTPELRETVEASLQATAPDIAIPLNSKVLSYVQAFQGRLRDWMLEGLQRGGRYLPMIQSVFRAEGLPLDLAYVALIESAFKPNALSRARAKGVWQFMRGTAIEHGLKQDWYVDERSDPERATYAAAQYLRSLHEGFDGDWLLALASYNTGPGRVQRAIKRSRRRDFWSLAAAKALPRETREYVPMVLAAIIIAKNPAEYGFDVIADEPIPYETVELPRAVDLRRVAEWVGTSLDEIQALNPQLRRWLTPVSRLDYVLRVPSGAGDSLREHLGTASPAELEAFSRYTVRRGESLTSIARKLKVTRSDLAAANDLSVRARVRPGRELIVPRPPGLTALVEASGPAGPVTVARLSQPSASPDDPFPAGGTRAVYRVKRGDTLFSIARMFQTTIEMLKSWNGLRGSRINVGDRLVIYRTSVAVVAEQQ